MAESLSALLERDLPGSVGPCLFRRLGDGWLVTNEWGCWQRLSDADFRAFLAGTLDEASAVSEDLRVKGFLRHRLDFRLAVMRMERRTAPLRAGGTLHVVALARDSDQTTPYAGLPKTPGGLMSLATARRVVRFIFESPSSEVTLQLRGGEPLRNWEVLEFIVRHARSFAASVRKRLRVGLVSNLAGLDDAKLAFLAEKEVLLGVPLDGPSGLHDRLRRDGAGGGTHAALERWLRAWRERYPKAPAPEGLLTVTRLSLGRAGEALDEYLRLGLAAAVVRPLFPAGAARGRWPELGVDAEQYLGFYADFLARAAALEGAGADFVERGAAALACRLLSEEDPGLTELGPVFGGGARQLAYGVDGDVYLCAEGLDLAMLGGDAMFRLGGVDRPRRDVVGHPTVRAALLASELGSQPLCRQCAYRPYCGVSPVYNYAAQGSLHGRNPANARCQALLGQFDLLFGWAAEGARRERLERWARAAALKDGEPLHPFLTGGLV